MDPLSLLKKFNLEKKVEQVEERGDRVHFGDSYVFPKTSYTAFKPVRGDDYYTLETVLFILKTRSLPHAEYLRLASNSKHVIASQVDRKVRGGQGGGGDNDH